MGDIPKDLTEEVPVVSNDRAITARLATSESMQASAELSGRNTRSTRLLGFPQDAIVLTLVVLITVRMGARASQPIADPDTWWHLRLGEEFRSDWSLSQPGQLSSFGDRPWVATQWSLEVLAHMSYESFGLAGVRWLAVLGVTLLSGAIYIASRHRGGVLAAGLATAAALLGSSASLTPRPQVASFVFISIVMLAWLRTAEDLRPRWWLIPLMWFWACTHGMWSVGLMIGAVAILGMLLDKRADARQALKLAVVPIAGLAAVGMTPAGPRLLLAPFGTGQMAQFVTEWQPPNFADPAPAGALAMVVVTGAIWAKAATRPSWLQVLLAVNAVLWIVLYGRTVAVGAVMMAPLLAAALQSLLPEKPATLRPKELLTVSTACVAIMVGFAAAGPFRAPDRPPLTTEISRAIDALPAGTVVFNTYELGGWLEWRHRNMVPVIDGMTDAYRVDHMFDYLAAVRMERGWYKFLEQAGAKYALLESDDPLALRLIEDRGWIKVSGSQNHLLLTAPTSA